MSNVNTLVLDLFEAVCNSLLSSGEARLLKLRCGIKTGYPPMRSAELAMRFRLTREQIRQRIALALVKLPRDELEVLKSYLDDEKHRFHQGLTAAQRTALRQSIEIGLQLQQIRKTKSVNITQTAESLHTTSNFEKPKASAHSSKPSPSIDSTGRLSQIHLPIRNEDRSDGIFELLVLTREWINEAPITYREVWRKLSSKVVLHAQPQHVFDLWYALGLFPAIDFQSTQNQIALVTVSANLGIVDVRDHALRAVMERVTLMPEVLTLAARSRRSSTSDLRAQLATSAELSGVQMKARLRTLEALGALRNDRGWMVTDIGASLLGDFPAADADIAHSAPVSFNTGPDPSCSDGIGFLEL